MERKKIERNRRRRNADENFMQLNQDARETFSIWRFNGRQPEAYGQSSLMLLFCCCVFLRHGTLPLYGYLLFITATARHFKCLIRRQTLKVCLQVQLNLKNLPPTPLPPAPPPDPTTPSSKHTHTTTGMSMTVAGGCTRSAVQPRPL